MGERTQWQYCQIELGANNTGILKQFVTDRPPVETQLHQTWPAMIAKLGEQGWEMVSVLAHEGGLGRRALTYVFKRPLTVTGNQAALSPSSSAHQPPHEEKGPAKGFEPLRGAP